MGETRTIPLLEPDIGAEERRAVDRCLQENWVSSAGPYVDHFEATLATRCDRAFAVGTASGTTALHLLLISLGIGPGDKVVLPDWTFAATANAVIHAGAEPVFVDVDQNWGLDAGHAEAILAAQGRAVKAIIAVDPPNGIADFTALQAIAHRHDTILIEDAAGALGSERNGRRAGGFGHAAIVSFNGNKILTTGAGGAILTDDDDLAKRARHLSKQARTGPDYDYDAVGFNCRMAAVNAALGLAQLQRFDDTLVRRQTIRDRYYDRLAKTGGISLQPLAADIRPNGWMSCIRLANRGAANDLVAFLDSEGITARPFWTALSKQQPYSRYESRTSGMAASLSGSVVGLPSSTTLSDGDQARVIDAVTRWASAQ